MKNDRLASMALACAGCALALGFGRSGNAAQRADPTPASLQADLAELAAQARPAIATAVVADLHPTLTSAR